MTYTIDRASSDDFLNTMHSARSRQLVNIIPMSIEEAYMETFNRPVVSSVQLNANRTLLWNRLKKSDEWDSNKNDNGEFFIFFRDELLEGSTSQYYVDMIYMSLGTVKVSTKLTVINKSLKKPGFNIKLDDYSKIKRLITLQLLA